MGGAQWADVNLQWELLATGGEDLLALNSDKRTQNMHSTTQTTSV